MKTKATVMQVSRGLLVLTPAEYDKQESGMSLGKKKEGAFPNTFGTPQVFELNDQLKDHPFDKTADLALFVKRCAESIHMDLGDVFIGIEDEEVMITKEYKHPPAKEKLLPTYAHVEAEAVLHADVAKYTVLNYEYGQQFGKEAKKEEITAALFAMYTSVISDIRVDFEKEGIHVVKIGPTIAGLMHECKNSINSATRSIAVLSVDLVSTRIVVLRNGAPVFQQASSSVLEDIADMLSLEFGVSKLGAIEMIRTEGIGVCEKCSNAHTRKQTMTMLDNAASEVLRNLRMVISQQRLDIDQIVLCDTLYKLPNLANYCRSIGLTAPMEAVTNLYTGSTMPPAANQGAADAGYTAGSFITMNGLLSMPIQEGNMISVDTSVLNNLTKESKTGKYIAYIITAVAAIWMIGVGAWWILLNVQRDNDNNELVSPKYDYAKQLMKQEEEYTNKLANMEKDLETMPTAQITSREIISEAFTQLLEKVNQFSGFSLDNTQTETNNIIHLTCQVADYAAFRNLANEIDEAKFFKVSEAFNAQLVEDKETGKTYWSTTMTLQVTDEAIAASIAKRAEDTADQQTTEGGNT